MSLSVSPRERLLHLDSMVDFYSRTVPEKSKKIWEELKKRGA